MFDFLGVYADSRRSYNFTTSKILWNGRIVLFGPQLPQERLTRQWHRYIYTYVSINKYQTRTWFAF
jgi:hypothetical protein